MSVSAHLSRPEARAARNEATRARVLDAAAACIARDGVAASNLARIARQAGLTTGAIQHQFGDKATLLTAVVERGFESMVDEVARIPAGERGLEERVRSFIEALWRAYTAPGTRASLDTLLATRGDAALHRRSLAFLSSVRERIDRLWMGTFWDVDCDRPSHVEAQRLVFTTLNGLVLEQLLVPEMPDAAADHDRLCRAVVEELRRGAD